MRGFTLIELVMVIMITGILAASLTLFLVPAINGYFDTRRRADLTDMADTALRRMSQDIRRAVPNSVVPLGAAGSCFELVPTTTGGRYRVAPDTVIGGSAALDTGVATTSFDVLNQLSTAPAVGDWVVIDNQTGTDVYTDGINRSAIAGVDTLAPGGAAIGQHRITVDADTATAGIQAFQFPVGYDGGRFVVVAAATPAVVYSCPGDGTLRRNVVALAVPAAASCGAAAAPLGDVVATDVVGCTFVYAAGAGATQESGFVWMRLELGRAGENIVLSHGVHVDNVP